MKVCFELSMPNVNSWNGQWSGQGKCYCKVVDFGRSKAGAEKARSILDAKSYYYNFGDGWGASVSVREVDSKEATKLRRRSDGFCGYEWMIESIRKNVVINAD